MRLVISNHNEGSDFQDILFPIAGIWHEIPFDLVAPCTSKSQNATIETSKDIVH